MLLLTMAAVRFVAGLRWRDLALYLLLACAFSAIFSSSCARPVSEPAAAAAAARAAATAAAQNTERVRSGTSVYYNSPNRVFGDELEGEDHLTPYPNGRHGSSRTIRDVEECQHVSWGNSTYEEFKPTNFPQRMLKDDVSYKLHKFMDTEDGMRYIIGTIAFVEDPYYTLSVLEPSGEGGCEFKYFYGTRSSVLETVSKRKHGCKLAANAGYFSVTNAQCYGNVVSNGRVVQTAGSYQNANFGIRMDGTIVVGYLSDEEVNNKTNPFRQLVTGVVWLVRNGTNVVNESMELECSKYETTGAMETFINVRSARTAIGHDAQGRLVLAQVEGQTFRRGANLYEFADLLIRKGMVNAINLDGGGSNTLLEKGVLINYPSDHCQEGIYRCARQVSTVLCVHDVECIEPDCNEHGSCDHGVCSCDPLWYGEGCQFLNCSLTNCSGHGSCENGQCSCDAGWKGEFCDTPCPDGRYGKNCQSFCWCYGKSTCNKVSGACQCEAGYYGYGCLSECKKGTFGINCGQKCPYPNCSDHGFCSPKTGLCICDKSWEGPSCNLTVLEQPLNGSNSTNSSGADEGTGTRTVVTTSTTPTVGSVETPTVEATCHTSLSSEPSFNHLKVTISVTATIGLITLLFHGCFCLLMKRSVLSTQAARVRRHYASAGPSSKQRHGVGMRGRKPPKNLRKKRPRSKFMALLVQSSTESSSL